MSHRLSSDRDMDPFCNSFRQTSYISDDCLCNLRILKSTPPRQDCRRDLAGDDVPEHKRQAIDPFRTNERTNKRRTRTIQAKAKRTSCNARPSQNIKRLGDRSRAHKDTTNGVLLNDVVSDPSPLYQTRWYGERTSIHASHPFECGRLLESADSPRHVASTVHHV